VSRDHRETTITVAAIEVDFAEKEETQVILEVMVAEVAAIVMEATVVVEIGGADFAAVEATFYSLKNRSQLLCKEA
jgi:NAD/NADP transhydrogenase beta subunit